MNPWLGEFALHFMAHRAVRAIMEFYGGPARIPHFLEANFFGPRSTTVGSPYYFTDGCFVGPEGSARFQGSKEYRSLPGLHPVIVDRWTYTDYARKTWIPVSSLAAFTAGVRFEENLPPVANWQFLDLETSVKGFKLGVLNDEVFTSPTELVNAVLTNRDSGKKVVCGFNSIKFDNRVLGELGLLPNVKSGSFAIHYFPQMLNVDLWHWARYHYPDAESKSLRDLAAFEGYPVDDSKRANYDETRAAEDNRMTRFLAEKIDVRTSWKLMVGITNCCPLILQNNFLDKAHKAILHAWYLERGYLPVQYPHVGEMVPIKGPIRQAAPGVYKDLAMYDVKNAYLTKASSTPIRLYDEEDQPIFTSLMKRFDRLIRDFPNQKPMLKFLAVSLVGSQGSNNNFMRKQSVYSEVVEGFAQEFTNYLTKIPTPVHFVHTDGFLAPANLDPPNFDGYELTTKGKFHWVAVYDKQRTLGLLHASPPKIRAKGFPTFGNNYPRVLRWTRDRFYDLLAKISDSEEARRVLMDPKRLVRENIRLPRDRSLWESTIWKEGEMFPQRWDSRSPVWNEWSRFKLGPNKYRWPRLWVRYQIELMLDQHRFPLQVSPTTSPRRLKESSIDV